jgi:serine protease inhibitor
MDRKLTLVVAMAVLVVGGGGCREVRHAPEKAHVPEFRPPATKPDARVMAGQSRFAWKLLHALQSRQPDRNLFFSPASLNLALAMVANGAKGETLAGITKTLELQGLTVPEINTGCQALTSSLRLGSDDPTVAIANSLWVDHGITLLPDYQRQVTDAYAAAVRGLALGEAPAAAGEINRWVGQQTGGMIPQIVAAQDLDQIRLVVVNALYFRGKWTDAFDPSQTKDEPFTLLDGGRKTVPMMSQEGEYLYLEERACQAISLPYGSGRLSLHVVLPARGTELTDFCGSVTAERWDKWMSGLSKHVGSIQLPRFRAECGEKLRGVLTALGMGIAFDRKRADFSVLSASPLWIDQVIHKAVVEVDEQGTKAAAATVALGPTMGPPPQGPFTMVVDRPFLCAIRDNGTGAIIFLGVVVDPEALARR